MQAVREINLALAADEKLNGKPANTDAAMAVIQSAGYDVGSYHPLTEGYKVYWVDTINRVVLVFADTEKNEFNIVYPEEYSDGSLKFSNDGTWHIFNESYIIAMSYNLNVKSEDIDWSKITSSSVTVNGKAGTEKVFSQTIAGASETAQLVVSYKQTSVDGNVVISNPTYSIVEPPAAIYENNAEIKKEVEKAAGEYLYTVALQINEGTITDSNGKPTTSVDIVLPTNIDIDMSNHIISPMRYYSGEMCGANGETATVTNVTLEPSISYTQSIQFAGSGEGSTSSKYNVYGIFDCLTGDAYLHDITYKNISINCPGEDYGQTIGAGNGNNANVVAIVGSICPVFVSSGNAAPVNVRIENVTIDGGTITGYGRVGGIVGYIGGANKGENYLQDSTITISNCSVKNVLFTAGTQSYSYGSCGAIISYLARCKNTTVNIDNCTSEGNTINGVSVGGLIGRSCSGNGLAIHITNSTVKNCNITKTVNSAASGTTDNSNAGYGKIIGYCSDTLTIDTATSNALSNNNVNVAPNALPCPNTAVYGDNYTISD